jgi:hypothetical protein
VGERLLWDKKLCKLALQVLDQDARLLVPVPLHLRAVPHVKAALDHQKPVPGHGLLDHLVLRILRVGPVQLEVDDFVVATENKNGHENSDVLR